MEQTNFTKFIEKYCVRIPKIQNTLKRINPNNLISYDAILSNGDEDTDKKEKSYLDIFVDKKGSRESIVDVEDVLERMFRDNEMDLLIARGLIIYGYTLTMIKNLYHLLMYFFTRTIQPFQQIRNIFTCELNISINVFNIAIREKL